MLCTFLSTPSARRATGCPVWCISSRRYFYPRPPRGGRHHPPGNGQPRKNFYPRPPRGGRHQDLGGGVHSEVISIHALREEGDLAEQRGQAHFVFLSTPSARRATCWMPSGVCFRKFLSTPSARRATGGKPKGHRQCDISIHALREEGDPLTSKETRYGQGNFYPRPPRGGRPSARPTSTAPAPDFYPRPPRGGRPEVLPAQMGQGPISIHALREEGDQNLWTTKKRTSQFLSTPSARRATVSTVCGILGVQNFYPRPPRGGRLYPFFSKSRARTISIHALREEGDHISSLFRAVCCGFLSTPSARRATGCPVWCISSRRHFYPRPPRGGRRMSSMVYK